MGALELEYIRKKEVGGGKDVWIDEAGNRN